MYGRVKRFNRKRGYGFITCKNGDEYFVNQNHILMEGFRSLKIGQVVCFSIGIDEKGRLQAINVKPM